MGVTNHPPYKIPDTYHPKKLLAEKAYSMRSATTSVEDMQMLETYQYSSNCLGNFITYIKTNQDSYNTIIAATGDHQMRRINANMPSEIVLDKAVPFYVYIPQEILNNVAWIYDSTRVGSHKDMMPTLMSFSLSEAKYFNLGGKNILTDNFSKKQAFGINSNVWITDKGAYSLDKPIQFYKWKDSGLLLDVNSQRNGTKEEVQRIESFKELQRWLINYQVMKREY